MYTIEIGWKNKSHRRVIKLGISVFFRLLIFFSCNFYHIYDNFYWYTDFVIFIQVNLIYHASYLNKIKNSLKLCPAFKKW